MDSRNLFLAFGLVMLIWAGYTLTNRDDGNESVFDTGTQNFSANEFLGNSEKQLLKLPPPGKLPTELPVLKKAPAASLPNFYLVMVETWRGDKLNSKVMPFTTSLRGDTYLHHFSTNDTNHLSNFSAFTGLFPTYYKAMTETSTPASLFKILRNLGYKTYLHSASPLDYELESEFMGAKLFDRVFIYDKDNYLPNRDEKVMEEFKTTFNEKNLAQFHLIYLKGSHFDWPSSGGHDVADKLEKTYESLLTQIDGRFKDMVDFLRGKNSWDNAYAIFLGSHGDEFLENGYIGHQSMPDQYQTSTAFKIKEPNQTTNTKFEGLTSHLDIMPTVMKFYANLGVEFEDAPWLKGIALPVDEKTFADRTLFATGTAGKDVQHFAFIKPQQHVVIQSHLRFPTDQVEFIKANIEQFRNVASPLAH